MIIVHVVEPFAAGVAVFVKLLSETMPDDTHIIIHGERRELMPATEVKKIFPKKTYVLYNGGLPNALSILLKIQELYLNYTAFSAG